MRPSLPRLALIGLLSLLPAHADPPRLDAIVLAERPRLDALVREAMEVRFALNPDLAAGAGLMEEAVRVPSYSPGSVERMVARIEGDLQAMSRQKWRRWSVDEQIDFRWSWAQLLESRRRLAVERLWERRPGEWLEPVANTYLAMLTYAPERPELRAALSALLPGMLAELRRELTRPTARDVTIGLGLLDAVDQMVALDPPSPEREASRKALAETRAWMEGLHDLPEFAVIGQDNYAWRLKHSLLLPWSPDELLKLAQDELAKVDAEIAELEPRLEPLPTLGDEERTRAGELDQAGLLRLYDELVEDFTARIAASGALTVPSEMGPIRARPTPEALIPLTGDGGSMNQAPTFSASNVGYWNVEHVGADWSLADREDTLTRFRFAQVSGIGPYAVHEGVPGHHLQLSVARLNPDPLRSVLLDNVMAEGWALYAEQLFWEKGGFGDTARARFNMLRSWRFRIRRVIYDVNVETGRWTLQEAADFKQGAAPGQGRVDEDLLRAINWPTQLICYFSGKMQILALRERARAQEGYSERAFHDTLLQTGSVPLVMAEARLFGTPLPELEAEVNW